jgi:hypothetical protein
MNEYKITFVKESIGMKKNLFVGLLFLVFICTTRADNLADLLQDLAIQTACLGRYSTAETGANVTSRYDDPPDWYDPPMMANRFAAMSGNMTRINTFYGVCFDYAQFAWNDIRDYQKSYNEAGMKGQQWYIAAANVGDPYTIILYDPVSAEMATTVSNGVYLKEIARHRVETHDKASGHAWLWVQHNNGTWYWIDPTWTDNSGYVWWGMVKDGKEVQYYPDPVYCVASNYPQPPRPGETPTERATRSPDSTYAEYSIDIRNIFSGEISSGFYAGYITTFDFDFSHKKYGYTFSWEGYTPYNFGLVGSLSIDYLANHEDLNLTSRRLVSGLIFGVTLGYQFFSNFVVYAGGGVGPKFGGDDVEFTWKVNGGLRVQIFRVFTKFDVSYNPIIGSSLGVGLGIFL